MPELTKQNQNSQSDLARDAATKDSAEVLRLLGTSPAGLTEDEAAARLEQYGPNEVGREKHEGWLAAPVYRRPQPAGDSADHPGDHLLSPPGMSGPAR